AEAASLMRMSRGLSHIHCHFSTNAPAVAMLSHALGGPTFSFTAHGPDEFDDVEANSLATKIEHSRLAVAITEYAKSVMTRAGGAPDKVHVVGCGLDLAEFPAPPPSAADAPLVCVGRLCPQKAQTLIPAAIAEAAKAHPDLKIRLIGDGESRAEVEAEIERCGVADRVTLLGWRSNDEVRAEIVAARALVLPSFAEGLPIVIMEAFALQRPVITTRITGIPELVDESCGWLIEPGDGAALAEAVSACMDAPADALSAMGAEGRARIEARHDIGKSAAQLEALFRS
ncbi:MAG: glycosyltransferase family 4 protein, partial [Pseudomonadota bacterium]